MTRIYGYAMDTDRKEHFIDVGKSELNKPTMTYLLNNCWLSARNNKDQTKNGHPKKTCVCVDRTQLLYHRNNKDSLKSITRLYL